MSFKFNFTQSKFEKCIPRLKNAGEWFGALNTHLPNFGIDDINEVAMFLAQTAHESAGYKTLSENLNYSSSGLLKTFSRYFRTQADADAYARQPERIANRVYGGRMANGPESSGDGWRFRGRGIIQITGRDNYTRFSRDTFGDDRILTDPSYLSTPDGAVYSACWYWRSRNINPPASRGDVVAVTRLINGGTIGLDDRRNKFNKFVPILRA
jgi:putative chitinase